MLLKNSNAYIKHSMTVLFKSSANISISAIKLNYILLLNDYLHLIVGKELGRVIGEVRRVFFMC